MNPSETLRKKLDRKAETIKKRKIPPSKTRSDSMKKKLLRGVSPANKLNYDCFTCPKRDACAMTLHTCNQPHRTHQCKACGLIYMYRYDPNMVFENCTACSARIANGSRSPVGERDTDAEAHTEA